MNTERERKQNTEYFPLKEFIIEKVIVDDIYKDRDARIYNQVAPTLRAEREGLKVVEVMGKEYWRVRKLTPKECWRLMGFTDEDYGKASIVVSKSQLYKQAGNSIVVPVLEALFRQLNIKGVEKWNKN